MNLDALDSSSANGFLVKIDGITMPKVIDVSGVKLEVDSIDIKQQTADGKYVVRTVMGRPKNGKLTITRGLTDSKTITDWLTKVMEGDLQGARKTATVELLDYKGETLKTYNYENVWVISSELSTLTAGATQQATEKFVLSYDSCKVS